MEKLSVRGYVEVLRHYREIVGIRRKLRAHFLANRPDLFIGVDAPDFNLDLELALKQGGIPTIHYVSPSIWAWRKGKGLSRAMLTTNPLVATQQLFSAQGDSQHLIVKPGQAVDPSVLIAGFEKVQKPADPPPPVVKVRCRRCQALNDEAARFCNQCAASL